MRNRNPVFWLMWALPGAAVLASFATLAIAMQGADRALPPIYHWEGESLDADFARAMQAARLGLVAELGVAGGRCELSLTPAPASGEDLRVTLTNGSHASLDRTVAMRQVRPGHYAAACEPLPRGRWRVAIQDAANTWQLRSRLDDAQTRVSLVAQDPGGPAS
jgi:hypothetical protein